LKKSIRGTEYMQTLFKPPMSTSASLNWTGIVLEHHQHPAYVLPRCEIAWHILISLRTQPKDTRVTVNGKQQQKAKLCDTWILPANQTSQSQWDGALDYFRLLIEPAWLKSLAQDIFQQRGYRLDLKLQINDPLIHQILLNLHVASIGKWPSDAFYADSLRHALGAHILRHYAQLDQHLTKTNILSNRDFKVAIAYIHDNLSESIQLTDLAQLVHMSPNYFAEQFKQATGLSPYRFVIQCRIQKAQELLRRRHLSIAELAQQVGIYNPSHFFL
jgi:AraC family transcriptional regulator